MKNNICSSLHELNTSDLINSNVEKCHHHVEKCHHNNNHYHHDICSTSHSHSLNLNHVHPYSHDIDVNELLLNIVNYVDKYHSDHMNDNHNKNTVSYNDDSSIL